MRLLLIAALFASGAALCKAEEVCPWMNTATASGILGGDAVLKVETGVCTFTAVEHDSNEILRIDVRTVAHPVPELDGLRQQCKGAVTEMKGIGNEAFVCRIGRDAQLAGRVRDRLFIIRASTNRQSEQPEILIDRVQKTAAQVAGNLF